MDSSAQLMTDGWGSHPVPDLRNTPLEELAMQSRDGHGPIQDIVTRMVDDGNGLTAVSATMFASAI
jgi:hypothetical protein